MHEEQVEGDMDKEDKGIVIRRCSRVADILSPVDKVVKAMDGDLRKKWYSREVWILRTVAIIDVRIIFNFHWSVCNLQFLDDGHEATNTFVTY